MTISNENANAETLFRRLETAEAEVGRLRAELADAQDEDRDAAIARAEAAKTNVAALAKSTRALFARAETAEAEVERLRVVLSACQQSEAYARGEMERLQRIVAQVSHSQE